MAHTISDCPRRASPAAKTPSTDVVYGPHGLDVPPRVPFHPELLEQLLLGYRKPIASSTSCAGSCALGAGDGREGRLGSGLGDLQRGHGAMAVIGEAGGRDRVVLLADAGRLGLLHRVAESVLNGHSGHGVTSSGRCGRLAEQLELSDRARTLADRVPHAVGSRVAAAITTTCFPLAVISRSTAGWATLGAGPNSRAAQRLRW